MFNYIFLQNISSYILLPTSEFKWRLCSFNLLFIDIFSKMFSKLTEDCKLLINRKWPFEVGK